MIGLIIIIVIIIAVVSFSGIIVVDVMGDMNNCKLWIQMNTVLVDDEFRDEQVGFAKTSFPETSNEGFFKIRFHADFYECNRWFDYDQVLDDIINERIGENYFDNINLDYFNDITFDDIMFWRS